MVFAYDVEEAALHAWEGVCPERAKAEFLEGAPKSRRGMGVEEAFWAYLYDNAPLCVHFVAPDADGKPCEMITTWHESRCEDERGYRGRSIVTDCDRARLGMQA